MSLDEYDSKPVPGVEGTKRAAIVWTPWMGDWFTSFSPRNGNTNAEGPWDHWVQLAIAILQHPATDVVRPDAHSAVQRLENTRYYSGGEVLLTEQQLAELMKARSL